MNKLINALLATIPVIGLLSGLSLSVIVPILLFACLFSIKESIQLNFKNLKIEFIFLIWFIASCFWSIDILNSMISFIKSFSIVFVVYILISNKEELNKKNSIYLPLIIGSFMAAIIIFYIEYTSQGILNSLLRENIQRKKDTTFFLHYMDNGCVILSLFSWYVIANLIKNKRKIFAFLLYIITIYTLFLSDSLPSFIGFFISGIVFLLTRYWPLHNPKILSAIFIISAIAFTSAIYNITPQDISNTEGESLPISARHRLFIWDFALDKAMEKPITGFGFNSSSKIEIYDQDYIEYKGLILNPLPLHPHNNLVQIILETGIVGFILYLMLIIKYLHNWNAYFKNYNANNLLNIRACGYACFSAFFIVSMTSFNMWQSWWLYYYLLLAALFCFLVCEPKNNNH